MIQRTHDVLFAIGMSIAQITAIIIYGVYFKHVLPSDNKLMVTSIEEKMNLYPYFQDIHIMIYVGFGFLLTSFHRIRLTALTNCFWVAGLSVQYYFLFNALWEGAFKGHYEKEIIVNASKLIFGEVSAGAILIALCAIIGKTNSLQFLIITIFGIFVYTLNEAIVVLKLQCRDVGGAMIIHAFGAFYGIGITWMFNYKGSKGNKNLVESHESLTTAMVGTLFLWCFWPSFNGALANSPAEIHMATLNTYFSMIGSVCSAYVTSILLGRGKFNMSQILNATLAGGVVMGSSADILHDGWAAYLVGMLTGIISTLLFNYGPKMLDKCGIHDVAGVLFLHGIPGFLGGLVSAIFRAKYIDNKGGVQVAGIFISMGIGLAAGLFVGLVTKKLHFYDEEDANGYFNDKTNVVFEEEVLQALNQYGGGHGGHSQPNLASVRPQMHLNLPDTKSDEIQTPLESDRLQFTAEKR